MNLRKAAGPFLVLAAIACEGRLSPLIGVITDSTVIGGGNTPPALASVQIVDNEFQPTLSVVRIGGVVVWVWATGVSEHNVTFDDGALSSPTQTQGRHTLTFPNAGPFNYRCTLHPTTTGRCAAR